ncbi:MAG TPA: carbohydrate ABC transporter permease [Propionibacteriaceae bacterium]|jgi:raffinose/stachyose/melibiose transport system permease protein|nr:carbohydrate ABC transporter permease [Propionibacteriaceae bacterium]
MTTTVVTPVSAPSKVSSIRRRRVKGGRNYLGGFFGLVWLAIIIIPVYYVVITTFKDQGAYFTQNPLGLPNPPTLTAYQQVVEAGIIRYFFNSVIVTIGAVIPLVLFSFLASYAIVRGDSRLLRFSRTLFLLGLAIPLQATIIPIYLIITRIHMYDSLGALILPSIAFGIPLTVLILSNFIRDVPRELFESMRLDGCTDWQMAWKLAFPLTRPAIVTVSIYNGLNVWNGFLFALILTQSPEKRVMPLALWAFQGEYQVNIPAILAAVVLSTLPILILYIVGRRQLLRGLTAGFGK